MFITLSIEEINGFPAEVKDFLHDYIAENLPLKNKVTNDTPNTDQRILQPDFSDQLKTSWGEGDTTNTRYGRNLVAGNFNWEQMMQVELGSLSHDLNNDLQIHVNEETFEIKWNDFIEFDKPSTWGFCIILCSLFGFGGLVPGFQPARNTKELCKNLEMLGISGGEPIEPRSIGPLLKSITKLVEIWHPKYIEGPPLNEIHWFDFDKRGNFYFAGSTFEDCHEAVKNVTKKYFM